MQPDGQYFSGELYQMKLAKFPTPQSLDDFDFASSAMEREQLMKLQRTLNTV